MYLSRLILNPKNQKVRRDIRNCQEFHRTIMSAFPDIPETDARHSLGVLYRIEEDMNSGLIQTYVQSFVEPDWSILPDNYLISRPESSAVKFIDENFNGISDGSILAFRLRANPTKKTGTSTKEERLKGEKRNGHRKPLNTYEEKIEWIERKSKDSGFEILEVTVGDSKTLDLLMKKENDTVYGIRSKQDILFASSVFEGRLRVTDKSRFIETLKSGIGSGKAYGFGLLSVAKIR